MSVAVDFGHETVHDSRPFSVRLGGTLSGGISGLVKNALDYVEDLRDHELPYLDGRAVGCIGCAYRRQATTTTLSNQVLDFVGARL
jgi:hypothetical protein